MKVNIIRAVDGPPTSIGLVESPQNLTLSQVEKLIPILWEEFQETQPDVDNQFIEYLEQHGFEEIHDPVLEIVL